MPAAAASAEGTSRTASKTSAAVLLEPPAAQQDSQAEHSVLQQIERECETPQQAKLPAPGTNIAYDLHTHQHTKSAHAQESKGRGSVSSDPIVSTAGHQRQPWRGIAAQRQKPGSKAWAPLSFRRAPAAHQAVDVSNAVPEVKFSVSGQQFADDQTQPQLAQASMQAPARSGQHASSPHQPPARHGQGDSVHRSSPNISLSKQNIILRPQQTASAGAYKSPQSELPQRHIAEGHHLEQHRSRQSNLMPALKQQADADVSREVELQMQCSYQDGASLVRTGATPPLLQQQSSPPDAEEQNMPPNLQQQAPMQMQQTKASQIHQQKPVQAQEYEKAEVQQSGPPQAQQQSMQQPILYPHADAQAELNVLQEGSETQPDLQADTLCSLAHLSPVHHGSSRIPSSSEEVLHQSSRPDEASLAHGNKCSNLDSQQQLSNPLSKQRHASARPHGLDCSKADCCLDLPGAVLALVAMDR